MKTAKTFMLKEAKSLNRLFRLYTALMFIILILLASVLSSCAPRAIGYQNHPLPPAYYPHSKFESFIKSF